MLHLLAKLNAKQAVPDGHACWACTSQTKIVKLRVQKSQWNRPLSRSITVEDCPIGQLCLPFNVFCIVGWQANQSHSNVKLCNQGCNLSQSVASNLVRYVLQNLRLKRSVSHGAAEVTGGPASKHIMTSMCEISQRCIFVCLVAMSQAHVWLLSSCCDACAVTGHISSAAYLTCSTSDDVATQAVTLFKLSNKQTIHADQTSSKVACPKQH